MLNVDLKIISKILSLSEKLKKVLPDLISSLQKVDVKNKHIGKSMYVFDILETAEKKRGFLAKKHLMH